MAAIRWKKMPAQVQVFFYRMEIYFQARWIVFSVEDALAICEGDSGLHGIFKRCPPLKIKTPSPGYVSFSDAQAIFWVSSTQPNTLSQVSMQHFSSSFLLQQ